MNEWPGFIAAPPSRRGRPPLNLPKEQKRERQRIRRAERYQRDKREKGKASSYDPNLDTQSAPPNNSPQSDALHATSRPVGFDSEVSSTLRGLALRPKSDDGEVRWVKSLTPENYTATANLVNVRGESLNPALVIAQGHEQSPVPSTTPDQSGSERPSTYTGGPILESVETTVHQEVQLPRPAMLDPLLRWLNDFTLYDSSDGRSFEPSRGRATSPSFLDENVRPPRTTAAVIAYGSQGPTTTLSIEEEELRILDQIIDPETIQLGRSAADFVLSQLERPASIGEPGGTITDCDSHPSLSLAQIAEHIRGTNIPDVLAQPALLDQPCGQDTDWKRLLTGGEDTPILNMARSHLLAQQTQAVYDVDSILARLNCLSACRGIRFSLYPKVTWNMKSDLHVPIQGRVLDKTPHLRLGSPLDGDAYSIFIYFPHLDDEYPRRTTYLRTEEHKIWVDEIFLPSISEHCPLDVTQHFPRRWQEAADKISARKKEDVWQRRTYDLNLHYTLPMRYLADIWQSIQQRTSLDEYRPFRNVFLVLSGKDLKLQFKSPTLSGSCRQFSRFIRDKLNWEQIDLQQTWVDLAREDTPMEEGAICLWNCDELDRWIEVLRHKPEAPLSSHRKFSWHLTDQAGSASTELRLSHPLRRGGIIYGQRYNLYKDLFITSEKGASTPFANPRMEGVAVPDHLLEIWLTIARIPFQSQGGKARSDLRKAFIASKKRVHQTLLGAQTASFGVREEYRITWRLFLGLPGSVVSSTPTDCELPIPFWKIRSTEALNYVRWDCNRWLTPIEHLHAQSLQNADQVSHITSLSNILFRCVRASLGCAHLPRSSELWKEDYMSKDGRKQRGLGFQSSLQRLRMVWLPPSGIDWELLSFRSEIRTSSYFEKNGYNSKFIRSKEIDAYNAALQRLLVEGKRLKQEIHDQTAILETLQKIRQEIYRQFIMKILYDVCKDADHTEICLADVAKGLSAEIVSEISGESIYVVRPRIQVHEKGLDRYDRPCTRSQTGRVVEARQDSDRLPQSRFLDRLQGLFDWDDGRPRSHWEKYAYRDLAKQAYYQIATYLGAEEAIRWRSTLGLYAARYIWIIPSYSSSRMWTYTRAGKSEDEKTTSKRRRKWLSGIYLPAIASYGTEMAWTLGEANDWRDAPWKGRKWMSGKPGGLDFVLGDN